MKHWFPIVLSIPDWLNNPAMGIPQTIPSVEQRMAWVIDLARINVEQGGGPFAAAVFNQRSGELIAPGVNWVVHGNSSLLHAEVMALALAEQTLASYDLSLHGSFELITSAEPCCQCLGVLMWTGIASLVCGACSEDVQRIGFDEGPRSQNWQQELEQRGIGVTREVMRPQAIAVLQSYTGKIYNSHWSESNPSK